MNSKKIIFIIITLIAISIFSFPYLKDVFISNENYTHKTLRAGEYEIGLDFPSGEYDFQVTNNIFVQGKEFHDGAEAKGIRFHKGEMISIEGVGELEISPAANKILPKSEDDSYTIAHSGNYEIGEQLESGLYDVRLQGDVSMVKELPLLQIIDKSENVKESISLPTDEVVSIDLEKGNYLQVEKSIMEELNQVIIVLSESKS
jgi:hypothetical protein